MTTGPGTGRPRPDDASEPVVDHPALLAALAAAARRGRRPLAELADLLGDLVAALGAVSGSAVAYDEVLGRVVAATPGSDWALGRRVELDQPLIPRLRATGRLDIDIRAEMTADLADQMVARGLTRCAASGVFVDDRLVGSLQVYFRHRYEPLPAPVLDAMAVAGRLVGGACAPPGTDGPLAAALADGLAVIGADGLVRGWNPAAQLLTGVPAREALGRPVPFAVPDAGKSVEQELAGGRWIQVLCAELADSDERVVTFRDITAVRRREQAKDLFVATASHELRTPVTVLRGYAETLDRGWERMTEADRREAVRTLTDRAERMAVLVDRLLITGEEERVDALLAPAEFDLLAALRTAASRLAGDGPHRLVLDLPDDLPTALGDEGSVHTVLSELVRNARKYSPGGEDITLTAGSDARTVYFRVADRGIGVQAPEMEHAFDRFWQAEGTDRRRFGGVGLGLYLVRRIVEGQHGWVSLRRRNPDGTVAEVRLPRAGVTSGEA